MRRGWPRLPLHAAASTRTTGIPITEEVSAHIAARASWKAKAVSSSSAATSTTTRPDSATCTSLITSTPGTTDCHGQRVLGHRLLVRPTGSPPALETPEASGPCMRARAVGQVACATRASRSRWRVGACHGHRSAAFAGARRSSRQSGLIRRLARVVGTFRRAVVRRTTHHPGGGQSTASTGRLRTSKVGPVDCEEASFRFSA